MSQTTEDLGNENVRRCIEKVLQEMSIEKYTIDISAGSIAGDNYLGEISKVVIKGQEKNGKPKTLNLIVKCAPKNEAFRALVAIPHAYDREIYMYSNVFPEFKKFQKEKGILEPFHSFAKYYESTLDDFNESLVMENMKELGFQLQDRHKPLDYNHVLLVMRQYGKLHALSYALRDQKPELFEKLSENTQETFFANLDWSESSKKAVISQCERALESLDPVKHSVAYKRFQDYQKKMFDVVLEVVKSETAGKYAVIRHGDCWINNILFKYGDSTNPTKPSELCFLDWQLSHVGSPVLDLAYFMFSCTDKELRDQHYDNLILEYYDSLSSFLRELGSDPGKMFPFEVLKEHLKKFCVFGLYMAIELIHLMTSEVEEIPDMHNAESIEDALEKFSYSSVNEEKYQTRIRAVILDFVKFGYEF